MYTKSHLTNITIMQYAPRAAPQFFALYCKTRNSVVQFAQINWALFQNVNKKSSCIKTIFKERIETLFKTASSVLKKIQNWTVSLKGVLSHCITCKFNLYLHLFNPSLVMLFVQTLRQVVPISTK